MPDLSMCPDTACPHATGCRRSVRSGAQPDPRWQSWLLASPRQASGRCDLFLSTPDHRKAVWERVLERDEDGQPVRLSFMRRL